MVLSGKDSTLNYLTVKIINSQKGSLILSGKDVSLTYNVTGTYTLIAAKGLFSLTNKDASLTWIRKYVVYLSKGSLSLSGNRVMFPYLTTSPPNKPGSTMTFGSGIGIRINKNIEEEDQEILAIIKAFIQIYDV